jgi:hypothetical protein
MHPVPILPAIFLAVTASTEATLAGVHARLQTPRSGDPGLFVMPVAAPRDTCVGELPPRLPYPGKSPEDP